MEKINANFLNELFRKMYMSKVIIEAINSYLDYKYIPKEEIGYKFILKDAKTQYTENGKIPSLGITSQRYNDNSRVQISIDQIKDASVIDDESLLTQLESFIKDNEFLLLNKRIVDLYSEGKKEEALRLSQDESTRINEFSLRAQTGMFLNVFGDFNSRQDLIKRKEEEKRLVEFGIDALDSEYGGIEIGDTELWIARSGVGKSTVLRWRGYVAATAGYPVLHIQCEESKEKIFFKYTQIWTNSTAWTLREGDFSEKEIEDHRKFLNDMLYYKRDIAIYSFKKFGDATISEIRNLIIEYHKSRGYYPKVVIIDSLNLLKTGISSYDNDPKPKYRIQECSKRLKNMAEEFECCVITSTQTGDVPFEVWNDEERVIDRSYAEGDRTIVQPYSWVFSINQTMSEKKNNIGRVFKDKVRDYDSGKTVFRIAMDYDHGRFYDRKRTMAEFYNQDFEPVSKKRKTVKKEGVKI